jgi:hypothetical protein
MVTVLLAVNAVRQPFLKHNRFLRGAFVADGIASQTSSRARAR